jgi:hypothetical protein
VCVCVCYTLLILYFSFEALARQLDFLGGCAL